MSDFNNEESQKENSVLDIIAEHKHHYSTPFGIVVSVPMKALFTEMIEHPEIFSDKEKVKIDKAFETSTECRAIYRMLGSNPCKQLNHLRTDVVPQICKLKEFYQSILKSHNSFHSESLVLKLSNAVKKADKLCDFLQNIEIPDNYAKTEQFSPTDEIKKIFESSLDELILRRENDYACKIQIDEDSNFGDYSDLTVDMNREAFDELFENIIYNLVDHAFSTEAFPLGLLPWAEVGETWKK